MSDNPNAWKRVSSKIVYQSPFITVREDQVATDNGKKGIYNLIDPRPGVFVIAETTHPARLELIYRGEYAK